MRERDSVFEAVVDSMKCLAQATAILATAVEGAMRRVDDYAARAYALYVSHDLRKFNYTIRALLKELGEDPDEPPKGDCRDLLGSALSESLSRALELLKGGLRDLDSLIDEGLRLIELSTIHALAHAKALELVDPPRADLARLLRVIVEDLRQHSRLLSRIKVLVKRLERLR